MYRLSSNLTLVIKLFLPVFWSTILVGFTLVTWFAPEQYFGGLPLGWLRYALLIILVLWFLIVYLVFWPLKRVETDGKEVYVSNYFRTAHYNLERDVEAIHESDLLVVSLCTLELNGVGSFGRRMKFLGSRKLLEGFREAFPNVMRQG